MLRVGDVIQRNSDGCQWVVSETGLQYFGEDAVALRPVKTRSKRFIDNEKCRVSVLCEPKFTVVKRGCVFNDND